MNIANCVILTAHYLDPNVALLACLCLHTNLIILSAADLILLA